MTEQMNPEVKAKWLAALRSGEYEQAKRDLIVTDDSGKGSYCCLGVLADLYRKDVGGHWGCNEDEGYALFVDAAGDSAQGASLTDNIHRWAGAPVSSVQLRIPGERADILANWNDSGRSFAEIADLIEEEL